MPSVFRLGGDGFLSWDRQRARLAFPGTDPRQRNVDPIVQQVERCKALEIAGIDAFFDGRAAFRRAKWRCEILGDAQMLRTAVFKVYTSGFVFDFAKALAAVREYSMSDTSFL